MGRKSRGMNSRFRQLVEAEAKDQAALVLLGISGVSMTSEMLEWAMRPEGAERRAQTCDASLVT
jgi:hypothetical protein